MIELYQFGEYWGINPSPFCLKVETYLRLAGLPYRVVLTMPNKSPSGKLPFIADDGQKIPDSEAIIAYLQKRYGDPFDGGLSAEQRATGHLVRRLCDEGLFPPALYSRWLEEPGWSMVRSAFFAGLPPVLRQVIPLLVRRGIAGRLKARGLTAATRDFAYAQAIADIDALAVILGDKPFLLGAAPTSFDAGFYAYMVNLIRIPMDHPLNARARGHANLVAYLDRIDAKLAPATGASRR